MPKKYKHIKLPAGMIARATPRIITGNPNPQGLLPLLAADEAGRKVRISEGLSSVEEYEKSIEQSSSVPQGKYYEFKVDVRKHSKELLKRLNIEPYRRRTIQHDVLENGEVKHYTEDRVIGRVSTEKLEGERFSNFEKLKNELNDYVENGNLPSYFDQIASIRPLTLEEVVKDDLKEDFDEVDSNQPVMIDFVFGDNKDASELKISSLEADYPDNFILKVNTELSHYCRMSLSKSQVQNVLSSYKGIIEITHAPVFEASEGDTVSSVGITPVDKTNDAVNPVIVADHPVSTIHPLLNTNDILVDQLGGTTRTDNHGSQVASLVVYGRKLPLSGSAEQKNKIIGLNVFLLDPITGQTTFNEALVKDTVERYQSSRKALIINLSANDRSRLYDRSTISHITLFLDELTHSNNCTFVISAGNMDEINEFYRQGDSYPNYFDRDFTTILAPADSINNITVGALTYQESADSIAPRNNPSPITRRGFEEKKFGFVKPDLVHYDSNCIVEGGVVKPEYNGPNLATGDTGTTKNIGTSFAAPLVSHDLGILAAYYPTYKAQTLKALAIHFARTPDSLPVTMSAKRANSLVGHGMTNIEDALNSLNTSSTIVIEDSINIKSTKKVAIPIPNLIAGSSRRRLGIRVTLTYAAKPNNVDTAYYCPISIAAHVEREDEQGVSLPTTQSYINGAHKKSNLKKYPMIQRQTLKHMGEFWNVVLTADPLGDFLPDDYVQPYSMVVTIEDMLKDDSIDIHEEISQMIEVRTHSTIDISV